MSHMWKDLRKKKRMKKKKYMSASFLCLFLSVSVSFLPFFSFYGLFPFFVFSSFSFLVGFLSLFLFLWWSGFLSLSLCSFFPCFFFSFFVSFLFLFLFLSWSVPLLCLLCCLFVSLVCFLSSFLVSVSSFVSLFLCVFFPPFFLFLFFLNPQTRQFSHCHPRVTIAVHSAKPASQHAVQAKTGWGDAGHLQQTLPCWRVHHSSFIHPRRYVHATRQNLGPDGPIIIISRIPPSTF